MFCLSDLNEIQLVFEQHSLFFTYLQSSLHRMVGVTTLPYRTGRAGLYSRERSGRELTGALTLHFRSCNSGDESWGEKHRIAKWERVRKITKYGKV